MKLKKPVYTVFLLIQPIIMYTAGCLFDIEFMPRVIRKLLIASFVLSLGVSVYMMNQKKDRKWIQKVFAISAILSFSLAFLLVGDTVPGIKTYGQATILGCQGILFLSFIGIPGPTE